MPEALPIPADLIDLQRALDSARGELYAYADTVTAERRAAFPDPEQIIERQTWTDEQNGRLAELREGERTAAQAVRTHPTMAQAAAEKCHHQTDMALRRAAVEA
ncbi:hypothetical protein [Kitasatospora sp. GP82]|uniref:hypothetical protein n=1 Tax=Kitasatospora sp. GP82 TaxID=3035089 RepID=UPI00247320A3|nr:hypothetical protein [Kitasatospora sp. GP82]MDH6130353.1 hypothetical protein [Kitasatospora sp. GP82]